MRNTLKPLDPFRTLKVNSHTNLHIEQTKNERKTKNKTLLRSKTKQHGTDHRKTNETHINTKY
jgi:hypothetical protein